MVNPFSVIGESFRLKYFCLEIFLSFDALELIAKPKKIKYTISNNFRKEII